MKKYLLLSLVLLFLLSPTRPQTGTAEPKTKADFLQKSRQQKTGAFVFLGLGALAIGIAAPGNVDFNALPLLVIGGGACILTSIVLFISSSKNKRRANNLSAAIKIETSQFEGVNKPFPAIAFRVGF